MKLSKNSSFKVLCLYMLNVYLIHFFPPLSNKDKFRPLFVLYCIRFALSLL
jgi:hypothetical protein